MNNEDEKKLPQLVKSEDGTMVVTDEPQTKAIEKHEPNGIIPNARNLFMLAEGLARSGMFPDCKDKYAVLAKIEYGRSLGVDPVPSLLAIHVVKGRLGVEAKLVLDALYRRGIDVDFIETTREKCEIKFTKPNGKDHTETFTWADAEKIKDPSGKPLTKKDNYLNYPEEMLTWRCVMKGARRVDPGAILGVYTPEEISMGEVAEPFEAAKAYDKKQKEKKKKELEKAVDEELEAEKERKKASPREKTRKVEKTKPEGSDQEVQPPTKPTESKVEPGKGDPSKLTDQERIELVKTSIMEDFTIRYGTQHQKENPDMPLKDYVKEKYRRFKLFLKWFQEKKNVEEGKSLCFVAVNEHGFLSLSEGNVDHVEIMWNKKDFTLSNFFEWEKLPPEEEDEEDPPF